eukprot:Gb_40945 [translate_table: standard]
MAPFFPIFTPTSSKPKFLVFGTRPVANITCEKPSSIPLVVLNVSKPSAVFSIASGEDSIWNSIPLRDICSATKSLISSSKPLRTFFWRINTCTSLLNPLKILANSSAMYPPPMIAILSGREGKSRAMSELMANSFPGMSGVKGRPPTETSMCFAEYNFPPTSTVCGSTIFPRPSSRVTPALFKTFLYTPVSRRSSAFLLDIRVLQSCLGSHS